MDFVALKNQTDQFHTSFYGLVRQHVGELRAGTVCGYHVENYLPIVYMMPRCKNKARRIFSFSNAMNKYRQNRTRKECLTFHHPGLLLSQ